MTSSTNSNSNVTGDDWGEAARRASAAVTDRVLRVADGIICILPICLILVSFLLLYQWQESWIAGLCSIATALATGVLAGSFFGWRLGKYFVGGTWWYRRQRDIFIATSGLSLICALSVIAYHQIRIPGTRRMEIRVTSLQKSAEARAASTTNPEELAKLEAASRTGDSIKEKFERAVRDQKAAELSGNKELAKSAADIQKAAQNGVHALMQVVKDPQKTLPTTDIFDGPLAVRLSEISVTNRHSYTEIRQSPPLMLKLFGLMGGIFGFGWMDGGRETMTEVVERATRGTPPSIEDIRDLLAKLKSTDPGDQERFLTGLVAAVERIQHQTSSAINDVDMKRFRQDIEKVLSSIRNGEGDRTINEALAALLQVLPAQVATPEQFNRARPAVLEKLEIDPDSNGPRFTTEGQKELFRRQLEKKRPNDWQKLWNDPQYGLRQIEVRKQ